MAALGTALAGLPSDAIDLSARARRRAAQVVDRPGARTVIYGSPPVTTPSLQDLAVARERREYEGGEHSKAFTRRMSLRRDADEIAWELAEYIVQASGATCAAVYLIDAGEAVYRLKAHVGGPRFTRTIDEAGPLPSWLRLTAAPKLLPAQVLPSVSVPALAAALAVSICWRARRLGFVVLGLPRAGTRYDVQDAELLATVTEAAAAIMAIRLSENPRSRRIDTLDQVTTAAIHDIKNSVSALSLLARNATTNFSDPEFQRDAIATLSRTVGRMQRVLATLSSSGAERPPARREPIDLQVLIIEATAPLTADPRLRIVRRLGAVRPVYGDRDALLRVVENLTTNAAEAIDVKGTVTITLAEERGYAVVSVADTGRGMSEEYRARHLFSPFSSTKKGGWGVGLYQTKQAVESQHGEILVDSVVGRGTTFTVKLPLRAGVEDSPQESVR